MIKTLTHINELIEKNKTNFKTPNYLAVIYEINQLEDLEIKETLTKKLNSIYVKINGRGVIRGNELEQIIKEFEQMQNMIGKYIEQIKERNIDMEEKELNEAMELNGETELVEENIDTYDNGFIYDSAHIYDSIDDWLNRRTREHDERIERRKEKANEIKEKMTGSFSNDLETCKEFLKQQKNKDGKEYYSDEYISTMTEEEIIELANEIFRNTSAKTDLFNRNILYGIVDSNGVRKYTDEEIQNMDKDEINEIVSKELEGLSETEINRIINRARAEELRREQAKKGSHATNYEEIIDKYKNQITKETPLEEAKIIIDRINETILELYKQEELKFEEDLKNITTVEGKLELIEQREERIRNYVNYYNFEQELNDETKAYIEEQKNKMINVISNDYSEKKRNGEYCWKKSIQVNESKKYIDENIKDDLKNQFDKYIDDMYKVVESPNQEEYDKWKNNMNEFVNNAKLDSEKITPYMTAKLQVKYPDKNLSVDKNFDIDGLGLTKTQSEEPNKKKGKKVKSVKRNIKDWFKKHPILGTIALGLAITIVPQLVLSGIMMINSSLWHVLGAGNPISNMLHSINLGLSKVVGFGQYKFANDGLYALGGNVGSAGANILYNTVGASLTTAALGLGATGGIGKLIANKIKNGKKKKGGKEIDGPEIVGGTPVIDESIYGPIEPELSERLNECETVLMLDSTAGPGHLIAPKDATEEQIENAKQSGKLGVGTYVVVTPSTKKIIEEYLKEKNKEIIQPENTPDKKDENKELLEAIKEELAKITQQNKELIEQNKQLIEENKQKDIQIQNLTEKLAVLSEEKTAPTLG